jgi:hypothetical protein
LLNSHDQEVTLDHSVDIRKQGGREEAKEPEPEHEPEPKERTMTVLNLTEWLALIKVSIRAFQGIDSN